MKVAIYANEREHSQQVKEQLELKLKEAHIEKRGDVTAYTEDDGATWVTIPEGSTVSMNMWGFSASMLRELQERFPRFLDENLKKNPLKCEFFLPSVVGELLDE